MGRFTVQPDELRTMAVHFGEAGERLGTVREQVAAAPLGDLGGPAAEGAAGDLLRHWWAAARELDDLTTDAAGHLRRCARAYETADASTLRDLGLR